MTQYQPLKAERCRTCGTPSSPQVHKVTRDNQIVTEAHYICVNPRCRSRFKIEAIAREDIKDE